MTGGPSTNFNGVGIGPLSKILAVKLNYGNSPKQLDVPAVSRNSTEIGIKRMHQENSFQHKKLE